MDLIHYLPIPFLAGGRSEVGVDCWGLVCLIYKRELGIELVTYEGVDWKDGVSVYAAIAKESAFNWFEIPAAERRPTDVVVLRIKGIPWHVGVVADNTHFIHCDPSKSVCIERFESIHWKNRVVSYHRLKQ